MAKNEEAYGEGDSIGAAVIDAHQKLHRSAGSDNPPGVDKEQLKSRVTEFGAETNGETGVILAWAKVKRV